MNGNAILSRQVDVAHLPSHPVEIVATAAEREKLAAAYDLQTVSGLRATVELFPGSRRSVTVEGRVIADVVQTCVVTLVPVDAHIDEAFMIRFVRPEDAPPVAKSGMEIVVDSGRPDPPEVLHGSTIDIGALAEEAFVLAIDPYPRAPDAALPKELETPKEAERNSPFAVLAEFARRESGDR